MSAMRIAAVGVWLWAITLTVAVARAAQPGAFVGILHEHPAIEYASRPARDAVATLDRALASGSASLTFADRGGYLRSVLARLDVDPDSQLLVFSKTGIQRAVTGPTRPRALYFNDKVVVGYIPGAPVIELAAHDPEQGVMFYTLEQRPTAAPRVTRRDNCLACHVSGDTLDVPGMLNRSMFPRADGTPVPRLGNFVVNHQTPLLHRWGGMYVTGNYTLPFYGRVEHMGNVTVSGFQGPEVPEFDGRTTSNEVFIQWMNSDAASLGYPSLESDIASLLLFDHQMHAINLLTRLLWETRVAAGAGAPDFMRGTLGDLVNDLADYFLFVGEAPPPARLTPRAGFAARFSAAAPKDRQGRSLRELDLDRRLLRYPCSYMIYSEAFDNLPAAARNAVYDRLRRILTGQKRDGKYAHLSAADRQAIVAILRDTKKDLPATWAATD